MHVCDCMFYPIFIQNCVQMLVVMCDLFSLSLPNTNFRFLLGS